MQNDLLKNISKVHTTEINTTYLTEFQYVVNGDKWTAFLK